MPFSSGTFSLYTPGNPVVTGTTISSTWANNTLTDIASGLSTCVLKDGTQTITANITMSGFGFTNVASITGSSNVLAIPSRINISGSNGGQITFPAVQNASTDANTLDDYEEGTFTPAFRGGTTAGTITYTVQVGRYTKVGQMVVANGYIALASISSSTGSAQITGLPFTSSNNSGMQIYAAVQWGRVDFDVGYTSLFMYANANNTILNMEQGGDNNSTGGLSIANVTGNSEFGFTIAYSASA